VITFRGAGHILNPAKPVRHLAVLAPMTKEQLAHFRSFLIEACEYALENGMNKQRFLQEAHSVWEIFNETKEDEDDE
jgi:hypothetical protein